MTYPERGPVHTNDEPDIRPGHGGLAKFNTIAQAQRPGVNGLEGTDPSGNATGDDCPPRINERDGGMSIADAEATGLPFEVKLNSVPPVVRFLDQEAETRERKLGD